MSDVWEGEKPTITVHFKGNFPGGTLCTIQFLRYEQGRRGKTEVHTKTVPVASNGTATYAWNTVGVLQEDSLYERFHYEATIDKKRGKLTSDSGDITVWAKTITILGKNADDGKVLAGAMFRLASSDPRAIRQGKVFHLTADDAEGLECDLWGFEVPKITWEEPYELVAWEKTDGRKRIAQVKLPPWKAVFLQHPEFGAGPGCKLTRKQYVNLEAGPGHRDFGHTIPLWVGGNQKSALGQEVYIEVTLAGPDGGEPSKRNSPLPELKNAVGADLWDYDFEGSKVPKRPKKWTAHAPMTKKNQFDQPYAEFELELGLAGGDAFTIKIGKDASCADGELVITNWRRVAYRFFYPGPGISDFGKLSKDNTAVVDPKYQTAAMKEGAKVFLEYVMSEPVKLEDVMPTIGTASMFDAKLFGGKSGKRAFALNDADALELVHACKAKVPLLPHEHASLICDYFFEPAEGDNTYKHPTTLKSLAEVLALKDTEITLPLGKKEWLLPHKLTSKGPGPAIVPWFVVASATYEGKKHTGSEIRSAIAKKEVMARLKKGEPPTDAELLIKPIAEPRTGIDYPFCYLWQEQDGPDLQDSCTEFVGKGKIKLAPDATHPVLTRLQQIWAVYPDMELVLNIKYIKLQHNDAVGESVGEGVLVYPSTELESDLHLTFLHELSHALRQAYGGRAQLKVSPADKPIPGVDYRKPMHLPDEPYAAGGGFIYDAHGHQGGHCGQGLAHSDFVSDGELVELSFAKVQKMWCLNAGRGRIFGPSQKFCPECIKVLQACDMNDRK